MPAPYSDNLYSGDDVPLDDDQQNDDSALSPTDGYFHASSPPSQYVPGLHEEEQLGPRRQPQSSNVPFVPNVMVEDPTLQQDRAAAKAKEAEEERLINEAAGRSTPSPATEATHSHSATSPTFGQQDNLYPSLHIPTSSPTSQPLPFSNQPNPWSQPSTSPVPPTTSVSPTTSPTRLHRRSIDEEISSQFASRSTAGQVPNQYTVHRQPDAPPAYSPSFSSPPQSSGYQTFTSSSPTPAHQETMGVPEESQSLLPRQPESMGGPPNNTRQPPWKRLRDRTRSPDLRKKLRTVLGVLVILSIVFALFEGISLSSPNHKKPDIVDKAPVKPPNTSPPDNMIWSPEPGCRNTPDTSYTVTEILKFTSDKSLSIVQRIDKESKTPRGTSPRVFGNVILQTVDSSSEGSVEVHVFTNDKHLKVNVEYDQDRQLFEVITPLRTQWDEMYQQPCIQLRVVVSIPNDAKLQSLTVGTVQLDVDVHNGVVLTSSDFAQLSTISGDITTGRVSGELVPYTLASRRILVETVSGDVQGWFPLYDVLKVHTVSGNIGIDIGPKPSSDKRPEPAALEVESISGDVKLREPLEQADAASEKFPTRDYKVRVKTASGDVNAELAFTSLVKFESASGDYKANLLPLFGSSGSRKPEMSSDTKSGDTFISLFEPLWRDTDASMGHFAPMVPPQHQPENSSPEPPSVNEPWIIINPDEPFHKSPTPSPPGPPIEIEPHANANRKHTGLSAFKSQHNSISGDLEINYPQSWEGNFVMTTISGSQTIDGKDLRYEHSRGIIKQIKGDKGDGASDLRINTMSGNEKLTIGKN